MKKLFMFLFIGLFALTLSACEISSGRKDLKEVYIIEFVSAPALDDARLGIIEGLKAAGFEDGKNIKITVMNPATDLAKLDQMAETAVQKADLIFAIATPVAISVVNEVEKQFSDVPVLFTAVTDPVDSQIIENAVTPGKPVSGTSDINQVALQVSLLKQINPDAAKIGFIYSTGEPNSELQLRLAREAASTLGLEVIASSATNPTDIEQVLASLLAEGLDALYIPTDNGVAAQMNFVAERCNEAGVITICGESNLLKDGGTITIGSVDYFELGKMTGAMGAEALNGKDVGQMSVQTFASDELVINKAKVSEFNLAIPADILASAKDIQK